MNNIFDEVTRAGMEASAKALKPCPFCGGRYLGLHQETNADGEFMMYIECHVCEARGSVKRFPKAQFADIKSTWNDRAERHGRWIIDPGCGEYGRCSRCEGKSGTQYDGVEPIPLLTAYCPHCGAKMDGDTNG